MSATQKERFIIRTFFQILIAILLGWGLCGILTAAGVFTDDKTSKEYTARTDARTDVIDKASWFYFPYPGNLVCFSVRYFLSSGCMRLFTHKRTLT